MKQWLKPNRVGNRTTVTQRVYLPFHLALKDYAKAQSQEQGREISTIAILMTLALRADPELRRLTRQYEQELGANYTETRPLLVRPKSINQ